MAVIAIPPSTELTLGWEGSWAISLHLPQSWVGAEDTLRTQEGENKEAVAENSSRPKAKEHFVILSPSRALWAWAHYIIHGIEVWYPNRSDSRQRICCWEPSTPCGSYSLIQIKKIGISFIYFLIMWKNSPFPGERPRKCCICIHQSILTTPWGLPSEKWQLRKT